jgi:hypothetical protein
MIATTMTIKHPHNTDVRPALNSSPLLSDCDVADGDADGVTDEGVADGGPDGFTDGCPDGGPDGFTDGCPDGFTDGCPDGKGVGEEEPSTSSSFNLHEFC